MVKAEKLRLFVTSRGGGGVGVVEILSWMLLCCTKEGILIGEGCFVLFCSEEQLS